LPARHHAADHSDHAQGVADAAINLGDAYRDLDPEMQRRVVFAAEEILCALGARPG
jgi:hypothetical protein